MEWPSLNQWFGLLCAEGCILTFGRATPLTPVSGSLLWKEWQIPPLDFYGSVDVGLSGAEVSSSAFLIIRYYVLFSHTPSMTLYEVCVPVLFLF